MKKITDIQIAEEFGLTVQTLQNWKNGKREYIKRYNALKNALIEDNMLIWEVSTKDGNKDYINNSIIGVYSVEHRSNIQSMKIYK